MNVNEVKTLNLDAQPKKHKISAGAFLQHIAIAMLSQAAQDAEILGMAVEIRKLNDPVLWERIKFKYQWSKGNSFNPEAEIRALVEWSWGQQYGLLLDHLELEDETVRSKLEELMHVNGGKEEER